jgi:hypothetical protein
MLAKLLLALSLVAAAQAIPLSAGMSTSCNNGIFCAMGQTCMSEEQGSGAMLACSPHTNATICMDRRFSCPSGSTCFNALCTPSDGGAPFNASWSLDAMSVGLRTYGKGIYILPTDAPGHVKDLGSDICNLANRNLPGFCRCYSDAWSQYGAQLRCDANVGNHFRAFVHAWFEPCGQVAKIGYTYGVNVGGRLLEQKQDYEGHYDHHFPIPGASFTVMGNGLSADAILSGDVYNRRIEAGVSLDVCGRYNTFWGSSQSCASESWLIQQFFEGIVRVPRKQSPPSPSKQVLKIVTSRPHVSISQLRHVQSTSCTSCVC